MSGFVGFSTEGLEFLASLGSKDKGWFDAHRPTCRAEVVAPAKAFVEAMGVELAAGAFPLIQAQPKVNGSMAPINNDLRFSPNAAPYKDHLVFKFWEGEVKKFAPTLWVRMHPVDGIGFASGTLLVDLDRWRNAVDEHGALLVEAVASLREEQDADLIADGLKRVPKPYEPDHPHEMLLRAKGFQIRWVVPTPQTIGSGAFVDSCVAELERAEPVHRWLVDHLG